MSNRVTIESQLHQARMQQLVNNIPGALQAYSTLLQSMNGILAQPACDDREWMEFTYKNINEEYSMILSMYQASQASQASIKVDVSPSVPVSASMDQMTQAEPSLEDPSQITKDEIPITTGTITKEEFLKSIKQSYHTGVKNVTTYMKEKQYEKDYHTAKDETKKWLDDHQQVKSTLVTIGKTSKKCLMCILYGVAFLCKKTYVAIEKLDVKKPDLSTQFSASYEEDKDEQLVATNESSNTVPVVEPIVSTATKN